MSRLRESVGAADHRAGPDDAPLTLVEYGDYECPHCGAAHPIVQEVRRRLGSRLRFVFRHFPLSELHPHAVLAAEAAEAAGAQGRFWEMHDSLFADQDALELEDLVRRAQDLGLDVARFERELRDGVHRAAVETSFRTGVRSGVNGTPTFFINGVRHDGRWDAESLVDALAIAAGA